jgi:DNA-binding GntR family transcriptional regulator
MKLAAAIARSLQADMQAKLRDLERAVAAGTKAAGHGLKTELRRQVASAGLGQRLANSWRDNTTRTRSSMRQAWSTPRRRRSSAPLMKVL